MKYRREIDGLRAIAVVSVIFFHAGFQAFSGGYVGVDIFFVISGYLITSIIITEQSAGAFSLTNFYERRARRILPALFLVLTVCLPLAWLYLMPRDMDKFSQSLVAVSAFSSNILFWRSSGYFETVAELNPLLHTWSLAVEEQFYLLFPIFLVLSWRLGKRWLICLLSLTAAISLVGASWGVVAKPDFTFFMLPTRGWELLLGSFVAFYFERINYQESTKTTNQVGSLLGLLLILLSIFFFNKNTPFPGLYALIPTVGTALIILFATPQTITGKLLGQKWIVSLGLISYSAYLWHQPLLAFARHRDFSKSNQFTALAICGVTFILAYLSWRYVEMPFRNKQWLSRKKIFTLSITGSLIFISLGIIGQIMHGDVGQLNGQQKAFLAYFDNKLPDWQYFKKIGYEEKFRVECDFYDITSYKAGKPTKTPRASISNHCYQDSGKPKTLFIWGDSHAQQLYWGLKQTMPDDWQILQVATSSCAPNIARYGEKSELCEKTNAFALKSIESLKPKVVLIAQNVGHNAANMKIISDSLIALGVSKVIFVGPTPRWTVDLPTVIAKRLMTTLPTYTTIGLDSAAIASDKNIKANFKKNSNVIYVSLTDYFCNEAGCKIHIGNDVKEGITSWDTGHITPIASYNLAKDILANIVIY